MGCLDFMRSSHVSCRLASFTMQGTGSMYAVGHQSPCRACAELSFYAVGLEAQGSYKEVSIQVKYIKFVQGTNYHVGAINEFRGESQSPEEQRKAKTKGEKKLRRTEPRSKRLNSDKVKASLLIAPGKACSSKPSSYP